MTVAVSVIIVSFNGRELIDDCLASVPRRLDDGREVEVIVVDNASADDTVAHLRARHPDVRVVQAAANNGFAAGNNLGFDCASGRHLLLLNSDARLRQGALDTLVSYLEQHPDVGMVGPRLLNPDGTVQRSARGFPTVWRLATEYLYLRKLGPRTRLFNEFYKGWFSYDAEHDMDFLMGACLLVRGDALQAVGPMNETYFMFSEETDWARRFWDAGWRVVFTPDAECVHLGGQSTRKDWQRMYNSQVAGHLRYLALHESPGTALRAKRLLYASLVLRTWLYRLAAALAPGARAARRHRARTFADAGRNLRRLNVRELAREGADPRPGLEQARPHRR